MEKRTYAQTVVQKRIITKGKGRDFQDYSDYSDDAYCDYGDSNSDWT